MAKVQAAWALAVLESLGEAVIVHDPTGSLVYANDAAARLLGFDSPEEAIATPPQQIRERFDIYDEQGLPMPVEALGSRRVLAGEQSVNQMIRAIDRETGEEIWRRTKARGIEGPNGEPLFVVTAIEDVTEIKRAEFSQAILSRTGELLGSSIDYRTTMERVGKLLVPELADWCAVHVPGTGGEIELVSFALADPAKAEVAAALNREYPPTMNDPEGVAEVLRSGRPQTIAVEPGAVERAAQDARHLELLRVLDPGSVMVLPMAVGEDVLGAMVLLNSADRRPFDGFDRRLASQMAERAAAAIDNARLATERSQIAHTLQVGLLPSKLPEMPGWSAAALYRPAGSENQVGGDFYDALEFDGGHMLFIGDVAGRGAAAAALTAMARYTLRTSGQITGDARESLRLLNAALLEHEVASLCSAAIVVLRHDRPGVAEIAVAGHPRPLLQAGEDVRPLDVAGPMLGAFDDVDWEPVECEINPAEQLVVYTDGVIEARGSEDRFGEERLRRNLTGAPSPAGAIAQVESALELFMPGELTDDAAMLVLRREAARPTPSPKPLSATSPD